MSYSFKAAIPQRQARRAIRSFFLRLHRYVGLSVGAIFVLLGLSGSVMAFYILMYGSFAPRAIAHIDGCASAAYQSWPELVNIVQQHLKSPSELVRFYTSRGGSLVGAEYRRPNKLSGEFNRFNLWMNRCTGEVRAHDLWEDTQRPWAGPILAVIMRLHTSLLLDRPGSMLGTQLVASSGVILVLTLFSGLYLWWPRRLPVAHRPSPLRMRSQRLIFRFHNHLGIYAILFLAMSLATGVSLYQPWRGFFIAGLNTFSTTPHEDLISATTPSNRMLFLPLERILQLAEPMLPKLALTGLSLPTLDMPRYVLTAHGSGWGMERQVIVDAVSGKILSVLSPSSSSMGDLILAWCYPLHTGDALGPLGRCLVMMLGLTPALLFTTGVIRWRHKRRAWAARKQRSGRSKSAVTV